MRKYIFKTAAVSAIAILAIGCQQKELDTEFTETTAGNLISAVIPEELGTKVSMGAPEDGVGLELAWEDGDALAVIGNYTEVFTIKEGYEAHKAEFEGEAVTGDSYTILYPGQTYTTVDDINAVSYVSQAQKGNATTEHLEWTAMVSGVDNYASLNFADGKANGVIKFHLLLPEEVKSVASITIGADDAVFHTTNKGDVLVKELTLNVSELTIPDDRIITAYMMTSWNDVVLGAGKKLYITITDNDGLKEIKTLEVPEGGLTIKAGKVNVIRLNGESWTEPLFFGGSGTEDDPYLIKTFFHLSNVVKKLNNGMENKVWYKMVADIDMKDQEWTMIAPSTSLIYHYDFNGDNHTISNFTFENKSGASFFGAITGGSKVRDLNFDNVVLSDPETPGSNSVGIVSYNVVDGYIDDVDVKNVTISSATSNEENTGTGVIACRLQSGVISNCDVETVKITTTAERVGGIVGVINKAEGNTIKDCTVKDATITGSKYLGGIVGRSSSDLVVTVTGCKLLGTSTITNTGTSTGGIIGESGGPSSISGCEVSGTSSISGTTGTGGVIGVANGASEISECNVSGAKITGTGDRTGGIAGFFNKGGCSIDDCHVSSSLNGTTRVGGVIGQISLATAGSPTTVSNCSATGITIYAKGSTTDDKSGVWAGGILGRNHCTEGVTIHTCKTSGTISTDMADELSNLGGLVGETGGALTMYDCISTVNIAGHNQLGGLVGANANAGTKIYQCEYKGGTITGTLIIGGIVGYTKGATIHDCKATSTITSTSPTNESRLGGIVGHSEGTLTMYYCTSTADLTGRKRIGGLVGETSSDSGNSNIYECAYLGGTITGISIHGGIIGYADKGVTITDCYSIGGKINATEGYLGGILGYTPATVNKVISRCYSDMAISTTGDSSKNSFGGIVGCFGNSSGDNRKTQNSGTITKCIAWNSKIHSTNSGTSGFIVGTAGWESTLSDCWRNPKMDVKFSLTEDHETYSSTLQVHYYNGQTADADDTVSSIAENTLDWSGNTWNFTPTNGLPTLKNQPNLANLPK